MQRQHVAVTLRGMTGDGTRSAPSLSQYEQRRWDELQRAWAKTAERRNMIPDSAKDGAAKAGIALSRAVAKSRGVAAAAVPEKVKKVADRVVDDALAPTLEAVVRLLELTNDWVVELADPERVLDYHRQAGRPVESLADLRSVELEYLDEFARGMTLRWRTFGAGEGAILGALAMIPVPVAGSAAAITLDLLVMQALTGAIATRVCYAYGFDPLDPQTKNMIDRMVMRAYPKQAPKTGTTRRASQAFNSTKHRVNWSKKLREDHRMMAAVEKLLKHTGQGGHVPVQNARMGMPVVSVLVGAGANSYLLGDTAKLAQRYAATVFLSEKHGLPLPANLARGLDLDGEDETGPLAGGPSV
ncbi:hypothetical protein GCM10027070_10030 [Barrientosiimonas humi]